MSDQTAGVEQGQKIGTIVKTAIDVALPGVSSILGLFWPKGKSDKDKVKKTEVEAQIKASLAKFKKQMVGEFAKNLSPIALRSAELDTLQGFLKESIGCRTRVGKMSARLYGRTKLSETDWERMAGDWKGAVTYLKRMNKVSEARIEAISFPSVRSKLVAIRDLEADMGSVESEIRIGSRAAGKGQDQSLTELRVLVTQFDKALAGIATAANFYTDKLQRELSDLVEWAKKNAAK